MPFPPYDAFGGFLNMRRPVGRRISPRTTISLTELNKGAQRVVDTFTNDYATLVRDNPLPFADLDATQRQKQVAIVGAGICGITALYELVRAGLQPKIFDGRSEIGGRLYSQSFGPEVAYQAEMGAMRFPDTSKLLWHYLNQSIVAEGGNPDTVIMETFPNPGKVVTGLNVEGQTILWKSDIANPDFGVPQRVQLLSNAFFDQVETATTYTIVGQPYGLADIAEILKSVSLTESERLVVETYWQNIIRDFDRYSLERFLYERLPGWTDSDLRLFYSVGSGTGGYGQDFQSSFVDFLRYDLWAYSDLYRLPFSSQDIARKLLSACKSAGWTSEPILETQVVSLTRQSNGVVMKLILPDGSPSETFYDYVIVATSNVSMVTNIAMDVNVQNYPGAPLTRGAFAASNDLSDASSLFCYRVRDSMRRVTYYPSTKIWALAMDQPKPWIREPNWPSLAGEPMKWILSGHYAGQTAIIDTEPLNPASKCPVLITYQNLFDSTRYGGIVDRPQSTSPLTGTAAERLAFLYNGMKTSDNETELGTTIFNGIANSINVESFRVDWHEEPYVQGAFRLLRPGEYVYNANMAFQYLAAQDPQVQMQYKQIYCAGEGAYFLDGWVEGPMSAAVNCVAAVLNQITGGNTRMGAILDPSAWIFGKTTAADWNDLIAPIPRTAESDHHRK